MTRCSHFLALRPIAAALLLLCASGWHLGAQELEPRLYQNAPPGLNALFGGLTFSRGNILVDPALPLEEVEGDVALALLGYARTFALFGKSAKLDVLVPVGLGKFEGFVVGDIGDFMVEPGERLFATRDLTGLADPRARVSVNFIGAPAIAKSDFRDYSQGTIVGASLQVTAPLGQYDPTKLFNLGTNRWTLRPEIGLSQALGPWVVEVASSVFLFSANDDFFGGNRLTQDPFWTVKMHVIRNFKPGLWVSANFGHGRGGRLQLNGKERSDLRNWRFGLTVSIPLKRGHRLVVVGASGRTSRVGSDFDTVGLIYQRTWG